MGYRSLIVAYLCVLPIAAAATEPAVPTGGRAAYQPEAFLRTGDAVAICLRRETQWIDFCNGLIQGYAENAMLRGAACVPYGTTRRELVEVFTAPEVVVTTGYIDDLPALETAIEVFARHYPCD